ncbi:hypothetical protein LIER_17804 [Lithospermum erythrorhizon]|uniref:Uncharacterized protein n=1 Tax=Lithospermum erythrorhizon TaxID=34254 RepID=A0AAV3QE64_LITER
MSYKGGKVEYFDYCDGDTFELGSVESWAFRFVNTNGLDDLEDSNGNFRISTESVEMLKALNIERTNKLSIIEFHLDDDTCGGVVDEVVGGVVDKIVGGAADNDHDGFDDGDLGGAEPMLSAAFLEQHVREVVVPDHEEDNHEDDIDGPNMEKPSGEKSDFDSGDTISDIDGESNDLRMTGDTRRKRRLLPDMSISVLKIASDKKFGIMITTNQVGRTREKALKAIEGDHIEHYMLVWGYIEELKKSHPGSTVFAEYEDIPEDANIEDLSIVNEEQYVIMSDKQKGLESALHELFSRIEHRKCVQHIYKNSKRHHGSQFLRDKLWTYARASTELRYNADMFDLKETDLLPRMETNVEKSIIAMLERIRSLCMEMIKDRRLAIGTKPGPLCPRISKLLDKRICFANGMSYAWNGLDGYEVFCVSGEQFKAQHKAYLHNLYDWMNEMRNIVPNVVTTQLPSQPYPNVVTTQLPSQPNPTRKKKMLGQTSAHTRVSYSQPNPTTTELIGRIIRAKGNNISHHA